jgi:hypothetical protein
MRTPISSTGIVRKLQRRDDQQRSSRRQGGEVSELRRAVLPRTATSKVERSYSAPLLASESKPLVKPNFPHTSTSIVSRARVNMDHSGTDPAAWFLAS